MVAQKVIDAHFHIWDLEANPHYPWLLDDPRPSHMGDYRPLQRTYGAPEYRFDLEGFELVGCVHVEAGWRRESAIDEVRWLAAVRERQSLPTAVIAFCDLGSEDPLPGLEALAAFDIVRGVRFMSVLDGQSVHELRPGENRIATDRFVSNLRHLGRFGFSFDVQATPAIFSDVARAADAAPMIGIALTHAGLPLWRSSEALDLWRDGLADLARRPNIYVKLSGLAMIDPSWSARAIGETADTLIELFGSERCMFGTNFPVDKLRADPTALAAAYRAGLAHCSESEQQALFGQTANQFYRLGLEVAFEG